MRRNNKTHIGVGYGDILRFVIPVFIGRSINAMIGFISRIIAGEMGDKAFNGINIGMMVFFIILTVFMAIGIGTTVLVAQHWGREDYDEAGRIIKQSLVLGALTGLIISAAGLLGNAFFFSFLKSDPETITYISEFFFWTFIFLPFVTPGIFLTAALRGAGDFKTPMKTGFVVAGLSVFLIYSLCLGKFGFPRLEAAGCALALMIAYGTSSLILIFKVFFKRTVLRLPKSGWMPNMHWVSNILKIGTPSAGEWIFIRLGMFMYIFVVTYYGETTLAGYFAGISFLTLAYALNYGFQAAATTLVGQAVGSEDHQRAKTALKRCIHLSLLFMALTSIALYCVSEDVLSFLFRKLSPESIHHARIYVLTLIPAMPLMGISFVLVGGLRGTGDTVRPLIATAIGILGGRIALAFLIYFLFHPPVYIIWCTLLIDISLRIFILLPRVKTLKLKKKENNDEKDLPS